MHCLPCLPKLQCRPPPGQQHRPQPCLPILLRAAYPALQSHPFAATQVLLRANLHAHRLTIKAACPSHKSSFSARKSSPGTQIHAHSPHGQGGQPTWMCSHAIRTQPTWMCAQPTWAGQAAAYLLAWPKAPAGLRLRSPHFGYFSRFV